MSLFRRNLFWVKKITLHHLQPLIPQTQASNQFSGHLQTNLRPTSSTGKRSRIAGLPGQRYITSSTKLSYFSMHECMEESKRPRTSRGCPLPTLLPTTKGWRVFWSSIHLFLHVTKSQLFLVIWILIDLIHKIWETPRY